MFNAPGLPPNGDPRTPDIIVSPNVGVTYSGSSKKLAEHGGFSHDDTNVMMLLSNPSFQPETVNSPVETAQIAPTLLGVARSGSKRAAGRSDGAHPDSPGRAVRLRRSH